MKVLAQQSLTLSNKCAKYRSQSKDNNVLQLFSLMSEVTTSCPNEQMQLYNKMDNLIGLRFFIRSANPSATKQGTTSLYDNNNDKLAPWPVRMSPFLTKCRKVCLLSLCYFQKLTYIAYQQKVLQQNQLLLRKTIINWRMHPRNQTDTFTTIEGNVG